MSQIILATNSPTTHGNPPYPMNAMVRSATHRPDDASYRAEQQAFHAYPGKYRLLI